MSRFSDKLMPAKNMDRIARGDDGKIHVPSRLVLKYASQVLPSLAIDRTQATANAIPLYADKLELYGDRAEKLLYICEADIRKVAVVIWSGLRGTTAAMIRQAIDEDKPDALRLASVFTQMQQFVRPEIMQEWGVTAPATEPNPARPSSRRRPSIQKTPKT